MFVPGQRSSLFITETFESWIKNEDAVLWVTSVAGLRKSAASRPTVTAHEIEDACISQRTRNGTKRLRVGPGAHPDKAVLAQEAGCLRCPICFAAELRLKSCHGTWCTQRSDRRDAFINA